MLVQDGAPSRHGIFSCFSRCGYSAQLFKRPAPRCPFPGIENANGPIRQQFHSCEHFDPGPNSLDGSGDGIGMIPDLNGPIIAAGRHGLLVRYESHGPDDVVVVQGWADGLARGQAPDPRRAILTADQHSLAIGAAARRWKSGSGQRAVTRCPGPWRHPRVGPPCPNRRSWQPCRRHESPPRARSPGDAAARSAALLVAKSQNRAVVSSEAVRMTRPSGLKAMASIRPASS